MPDHVHMMISIPPKYAVSQVIGYIKGKSAIHIASRAINLCMSALGGLSVLLTGIQMTRCQNVSKPCESGAFSYQVSLHF